MRRQEAVVPTDFNEKAKTWDDDPAKVHRARVVAEAIGAAVALASSTRLLEYGAGTGLVSQALADHVGPITLAEPSAGMRAVMADKVAAQTLPANVRIWDLDLATDKVPDERFDLVVTVMTLHHIHDPVPVLDGRHLPAVPGDLQGWSPVTDSRQLRVSGAPDRFTHLRSPKRHRPVTWTIHNTQEVDKE